MSHTSDGPGSMVSPGLTPGKPTVTLEDEPAGAPAADIQPIGPLGDYRIVRELGRGAMGVVYEAVQISLGRPVALKVLPFAAALDAKRLQRFKNEALAAAHLHHQNIVPVYGVGSERGVYYYAMQLIDGRDLGSLIRELRQQTGKGASGDEPTGAYPAPPPAAETATAPTPPSGAPMANGHSPTNGKFFRTAAKLGVQAAAALEHAHQLGIVHRDIKPGNLLVDVRGNLWITDFGLAHIQSVAGLTMTGDLMGTLRYMSPEQALAQRVLIDHRTDIYSLGATLYELLTLEPMFAGSDRQELLRQIAFEEPRRPRRLDKAIPPELETIVLKAVEKNPADRYATAQELADDLERFLNDESIRAKRPSLPQRARKWARRHQPIVWSAVVATVAVLLLAVGMLAVGYLRVQEEQRRTLIEKRRAEGAQKLAEDRAEEIRQGLERLQTANSLLDRGRKYSSARCWDDAHAAFTRAIELRPDHASVWVERGDMHALLGLWELAAADYDRELELRGPDVTWRWYHHALLCLYLGDADGYGQVCRRMRQRFNMTTDGYAAIQLVRTCVLAPDPDTDLAQLVELLHNSPDKRWFSLYVLGMAHYRAGQHEQAVRRLRESLTADPEWSIRALSYPVLAMAHHRLGQPAEARQALDEVAKAIEAWTRNMYQTPDDKSWVIHMGATASWPIGWWDWVECQIYYREARLLIDGTPPPPDPRLRVLRARAFAGLRWQAKADVEYAECLKLLPHDSQLRLEAHRNRGYLCVSRGEWSQAADEFARASQLQPDDDYLWHFRAMAHLGGGDRDAYRQVCAALLERFGGTEEPRTAYHVVCSCVLTDDAIPDLARLVPVARVAAPYSEAGPEVLGAALYRAGQYDEAISCFETAAKVYRPQSWSWSFLAMAHHRLGHADEARRCLAEAARWIEEANRHEVDDLSGTGPAWGAWPGRLLYPLLLREAEELIEGQDD